MLHLSFYHQCHNPSANLNGPDKLVVSFYLNNVVALKYLYGIRKYYSTHH